MGDTDIKLGFNCHGKGRVRVVKVKRNSDGSQDVIQLNVQILLEGEVMAEGFMSGDNATVVATDTCKNTVYCLAKEHEFQSIEEFGIIIAKHFTTTYPRFVNRITVKIVKDRWERVEVPDSRGVVMPHNHVFRRTPSGRPFSNVTGVKRPGQGLKLQVTGGFSDLEIMKTTQSGFEGFVRDRYTSLPEVKDRLVGTSVCAEWTYSDAAVASYKSTNFGGILAGVEEEMVNTFAGPADTGVYSGSVQQTLYEMGRNSLLKNREISSVHIQMPNIHNIPFDVTRFGYPKDGPEGPTIFFPIDEPHGMIQATVERASMARGRSRL
jgi:urate oxidase